MINRIISSLRKRTSIQKRLTLLLIVLGFLFYFASLGSIYFQLSDLKGEKQNTTQFIVKDLLSRNADFALSRGSKTQLEEQINALLAREEIASITVYDQTGQVFVEGNKSTPETSNNQFSVDIIHAQLQAGQEGIETDSSAIAIQPVKIGSITVILDEDALNQTVYKVIRSNALLQILILIPGILIVYLLANSLTRPLREIKSDIERFKSGDYTTSHDPSYIDEFAELSATLTQAGDVIANKEAQLQQQVAIAIEARSEADEANAKKDVFVANITHELKIPLTGVVSGLYLLEDYFQTASLQIYQEEQHSPELLHAINSASDSIQIIKESSKQLELLINDILLVLEDINDPVPIYEREINLRDALYQVTHSHAKQAELKQLDYHLDIAVNEDTYIVTDWIRVAQIINALIANAIRFTHKGYVKIAARALPEQDQIRLQLEITDSGIGISNTQKQAIFNLFHINEDPTKKKYSGIGIGLALAKTLANKLGCQLNLNYSQLGQGSRFSFEGCFKRATPAQLITAQPQSALSLPENQPLTLLYVEDSPSNQLIFQGFCRRFGINLMVANNGVEGFENYLNGQYDALVIDCYMPLMNGYELVRKIRQTELASSLPRALLIALTADTKDRNKQRCLKDGYDLFMGKPYSMESFKQLVMTIRQHKQDQKIKVTSLERDT